jgi:hypothetical protein
MFNLLVKESEKTVDWYRGVANHYCTFYNTTNFIANNGLIISPVQTINENYLYYLSSQDGNRNAFATQNTPAGLLTTKGNEIYKLVNALKGKVSEFFQKLRITTDLLSEDATNKKDIEKSLYMFYVTNQDFINTLKELGVNFNPLPEGVILRTKEDVEEFMELDYRQEGCEVAERIADCIMKINYWTSLSEEEFKDILIAGFTATDAYIKNGVLTEERVLPQECILDLRTPNDNSYNEKAMFRGRFINLVSPLAIIKEFGDKLPQDAIEEIKMLSDSTIGNIGQQFLRMFPASPTGNYELYQYSQAGMRGMTGLSVIKMYFLAPKDYRYKSTKGIVNKYKDYDESGNPIKENIARKGIFQSWVWHQATVIAGKYVVNHGIVSNQVVTKIPKGEFQCPMTVYIDDYTSGCYKSRVSRMKPFQDDINLADTKIKEAELNDLGLNYIILDGGTDAQKTIKEIYEDFKSMKMTMLKVDAEEENLVQKQFAQMMDFTGALKVVDVYQQIKDVCRREMENIMHMPAIAMGQQPTVIGKGVQQNAVQLASVGLAPLFNGFIAYKQRRLQLSANIFKFAIVADNYDEEYARRIVGDNGYEWLKTSVIENFEYFGIYFTPYDVIDDQRRAALDQKIFSLIQTGMLDAMDALRLDEIHSLRQAYAYVRVRVKQRKMEAQQAAEQQRMDNLQMAQAQNETMLQSKQIPAQAVVEAKKIQSDATSQDNERTNQTKKEIADLQQQVKLLTKRMESGEQV